MRHVMRHVQRGGPIEEEKQEAVTFDAATPEGIAEGINQTCEKIAVRVASMSAFFVPSGAVYPPGPEAINRGPFYAIVVFEEDVVRP